MRLFILLVIAALSITANSQNNRFSSGILPEIALNYKISENYSIAHKVETRHFIFDNSNGNEELNYEYRLTDFQNFIGRRLSPFIKADIGYQFRLEEGRNAHRTIQHISILQRNYAFRIGHRIRTDQTFFKTNSPLFRVRYRTKAQIPLQGQDLDAKESYLTAATEFLYILQSSEDDLEIRLTSSYGFYFDDKNKLEFGLDYRTDNYLEERFKSQLWLRVGYYKTL